MPSLSYAVPARHTDTLRQAGIRTHRLLPNEPRILYQVQQTRLTQQYLEPHREAIEFCLKVIREHLDTALQKRQPIKLGKPYPIGQCLEIAEAVQKALRSTETHTLPSFAAQGLQALRQFFKAGGTLRQVWGDLRGMYFQNAFQLGTWYVDVANDTVTPTKPKIEILPFDDADFIPIRDFFHFKAIAERYWQHKVYPNIVLPDLAPHCPLLHITLQGRIQLHDATRYMLAMTRSQQFKPSEYWLRDSTLPDTLFNYARNALRAAGYNVASTPEQGRQKALEHCRTQRQQRTHLNTRYEDRVILDVQRINTQLAKAMRTQKAVPRVSADAVTIPVPFHPSLWPDHTMTSITIDNVSYTLDQLSDHAKAQLQSIQFVDQELARLQAQQATLQTARNAYVQALKAALPT